MKEPWLHKHLAMIHNLSHIGMVLTRCMPGVTQAFWNSVSAVYSSPVRQDRFPEHKILDTKWHDRAKRCAQRGWCYCCHWLSNPSKVSAVQCCCGLKSFRASPENSGCQSRQGTGNHQLWLRSWLPRKSINSAQTCTNHVLPISSTFPSCTLCAFEPAYCRSSPALTSLTLLSSLLITVISSQATRCRFSILSGLLQEPWDSHTHLRKAPRFVIFATQFPSWLQEISLLSVSVLLFVLG